MYLIRFLLFYEVAQKHKHLSPSCRRKLLRVTSHLCAEFHEVERVQPVFPFLNPDNFLSAILSLLGYLSTYEPNFT
jgi:hypothetical protein